jgi:hypothetical protein
MFNYYFDTSEYTEILQYVSLFLLFVIGTMVYYMSTNSETMNKDIKDSINKLDLNCPNCPDNPACPACPKCPDLFKGDLCPTCPECSGEDKECPDKECPITDCPTVDDIVTGIFPGRNPGITSGGKYFDIMASDNYELLPSYDFYNSVDAFPSDSILSAPDSLLKGNVDVPPTEIDNSISDNYVDTAPDVSLSRMNMSSLGENTTPSTFGSDTTRIEGDNVVQSGAAQDARDVVERNMRSDLALETNGEDP